MQSRLLCLMLLVSVKLNAAIYSMNLPMVWQDKPIGSASFVLENFSILAINGRSLAETLDNVINEEVKARLLNYPDGDVDLEHLSLMGISVELNSKDLNVILDLEAEALKVDALTYGDRNYLAKPTRSANWAVLNNINLRYDRTTDNDDRYALEWLGDLNIGGHDGLNGKFSLFYDKTPDRTETYRGDLLFYYDQHAKPMRWEFGDLTSFTRGHLPSVNAGGIGISRSYRDLQPLTKLSPSNSQEFYLKLAAEVQVIVNGNIIAKVRLAPGRYDLNDLPLTTGENDVQVVAFYNNGEQESFNFSTFYNAQLLEKGVSNFSINVGKPSQFTDFRYEYLTPMVLSGFYEQGITNQLTMGVNGLYSNGYHLAGITATYGSSLGNFTARLTRSDAQGGVGHALSIDSEHTIWGSSEFGIPNLRLSYEKRNNFTQSPYFENASSNTDNNFSFNYTWFFSRNLDLSIQGRRSSNSTGTAFKNGNAQLNWRKDGIRISAEYRYQNNLTTRVTDKHSYFINFSWTGYNSENRSRSRFDYNGRTDTFRGTYTKVNRNYLNEYGYGVDLEKSPSLKSATVQGSYTGNHFRISSNSRFQKRSELSSSDDHRINLSTSIGIADGKVGVGTNIRAPFVVVQAHETLADKEVILNPTPQRDAQGKAGNTVAGLVSLGSAFTDSGLTVDVTNAPLGYDWGPGTYSIVGGSATGHFVQIGSDMSYTVIGYLRDKESNPIQLQRGTIKKEGFASTFFTNRRGRFVVEGVGPGQYTITIGETSAQINIEPKDISLIRLGNIRLK